MHGVYQVILDVAHCEKFSKVSGLVYFVYTITTHRLPAGEQVAGAAGWGIFSGFRNFHDMLHWSETSMTCCTGTHTCVTVHTLVRRYTLV